MGRTSTVREEGHEAQSLQTDKSYSLWLLGVPKLKARRRILERL